MMGIFNGTTNYVLTKMAQEGKSYEAALKEGRAPTRFELDEVSPDNPVILLRVCNHVCFYVVRLMSLNNSRWKNIVLH